MLGETAPKSIDHLWGGCQIHWDQLISHIEIMGLKYQIDHRLVRGLDYYTRTVFEIQPKNSGGQSTICGGGRYDKLIEQLGGNPTPGIGFGSGMERLTLNLKESGVDIPAEPSPTHLVANVGDNARSHALSLASRIPGRRSRSNPQQRPTGLKRPDEASQCSWDPFVAILGDDEISRGEVVIRDMSTSTQETLDLTEFIESIKS
ncbi:MAG: hypothetical protein Ct9H300mP27_00170 [Chloroflexota bacterium]|nr:MAG: hypothetical protein Ct9H300mP27_00170 [Chloroflexota bacterium]